METIKEWMMRWWEWKKGGERGRERERKKIIRLKINKLIIKTEK